MQQLTEAEAPGLTAYQAQEVWYKKVSLGEILLDFVG